MTEPLLKSRIAAREAGHRTYERALCCTTCYSTERLTRSAKCAECLRLKVKKDKQKEYQIRKNRQG